MIKPDAWRWHVHHFKEADENCDKKIFFLSKLSKSLLLRRDLLKHFAQFYFDHDNKAAKYFKLTLKQVFASLGFIFGSLNDVINIVSTLLSHAVTACVKSNGPFNEDRYDL